MGSKRGPEGVQYGGPEGVQYGGLDGVHMWIHGGPEGVLWGSRWRGPHLNCTNPLDITYPFLKNNFADCAECLASVR